MAAPFDRYRLYERCVQDPPGTALMLHRDFRKIRGRTARRIREDFAGTAALASAWTDLHPDNVAWAVDRDPVPLAWGAAHHDLRRVRVTVGDVLDRHGSGFDMVVAFNFSWLALRTRAALGRYLRRAREALRPDGLLLLDLYGGRDAITLGETRTRMGNVTYVWDQKSFDPVSGAAECAIHFRLAGGIWKRRCFVYRWRLWSIPELADLMAENGLRLREVHNEVSDDGSGIYRRVDRLPDWEAWTIKLLAERTK